MRESVPFGSYWYLVLLIALVVARGMDFLSTWIATPTLALEGNPLAKRLGWKGGMLLNAVLVFVLPLWPVPTIVVTTASLLVAARNFQSAWLMRSMGEEPYRQWYVSRIRGARFRLYLFCLLGNTVLTASVGVALVLFSPLDTLLPVSIGMGIITYSLAVAFYSGLATWRIRASLRQKDRLHTALPNRREPAPVLLPDPATRPVED
jgi:hypothetical protein